jgi:dTDP-4-dehydrorhamnose reductase
MKSGPAGGDGWQDNSDDALLRNRPVNIMRVLVIGKTGQLGRELGRFAWPASTEIVQVDRSECDLTNAESVRKVVSSVDPDVAVNTAAYTAVDRAESEPEAAMRTNAHGPAVLAQACAGSHAALIHISTDYVFDGSKAGPYAEDDAVNPRSVYGRTKLAGERAVTDLLPQHVIVRTSWVFSSHGNNFVKTMLRLGSEKPEIGVVNDQTGAPTSAADIASAIGSIVAAIAEGRGVWGTFHYASSEPTTWFDFAQAIFAGSARRSQVRLRPITTADFGAPAPRPANSVMDCMRIQNAYGIPQPSWRAALTRTLAELETQDSAL